MRSLFCGFACSEDDGRFVREPGSHDVPVRASPGGPRRRRALRGWRTFAAAPHRHARQRGQAPAVRLLLGGDKNTHTYTLCEEQIASFPSIGLYLLRENVSTKISWKQKNKEIILGSSYRSISKDVARHDPDSP